MLDRILSRVLAPYPTTVATLTGGAVLIGLSLIAFVMWAVTRW